LAYEQELMIGHMLRVNTAIDKSFDDKVFFYAKKITFSQSNGWTIIVQPDACMVSMHESKLALDTVATLRSSPLAVSSSSAGSVFKGKILFSAGAMLFLGTDVVMMKRDEAAPTDPKKWTSPAGRSDREPLLTALKEFHEEVILFDTLSNRPVYVDIANNPYAKIVENIYYETLKRKGYEADVSDWIRLVAYQTTPNIKNIYPVKLLFGEEHVDSSLNGTIKYFSFMDVSNSTLELLLPLTINNDQLSKVNISLCDGEYD